MFKRFAISLLFLLFLLFVGSVPTVRGAEREQPAAQPVVIPVGIYLLRAGSLDIATGAIDMDFYIEFNCPSTCGDKTEFEIINGAFKSKPVLLQDEDAETSPTFRVAATVFQEINLRKYPFDGHEIKIIIESSNYNATEVAYVINEATTAIDPNVFILGWELNRTPKAFIDNHYYPAWDQTYTRYEFSTELNKPPLAGWLKGLMPAIFIAMSVLFALLITSKNINNRMAVVTSSLVASVMYHLNFTSRVPSIGYLTFADTFMIINYAVILTTLFITIWGIRAENTEAMERINKKEIIFTPLIWAGLHILNAVIIL